MALDVDFQGLLPSTTSKGQQTTTKLRDGKIQAGFREIKFSSDLLEAGINLMTGGIYFNPKLFPFAQIFRVKMESQEQDSII